MWTLRDNANSFIKNVMDDAARTDFPNVLRYEDNWPAMANDEWRRYVLEKLPRTPYLAQPRFHLPCSLDGWMFSAIVTKTPMALRGLDDPMDPPPKAAVAPPLLRRARWYDWIALWYSGRQR